MTEPNRVDKSIKRHVVHGLVLSSHSPPGSVNPRVGDSRSWSTLQSTDIRQPRRVRRRASQARTDLSDLIFNRRIAGFIPVSFSSSFQGKSSCPRTTCAKRQVVRLGTLMILTIVENKGSKEVLKFFQGICRKRPFSSGSFYRGQTFCSSVRSIGKCHMAERSKKRNQFRDLWVKDQNSSGLAICHGSLAFW